jgi:hypothetical protein
MLPAPSWLTLGALWEILSRDLRFFGRQKVSLARFHCIMRYKHTGDGVREFKLIPSIFHSIFVITKCNYSKIKHVLAPEGSEFVTTLSQPVKPVAEILVGQGGSCPPPPHLHGKLTNFRKFWPKRGLKTVFLSANVGVCQKFESFVGNLGGFAPHRRKWISATVLSSLMSLWCQHYVWFTWSIENKTELFCKSVINSVAKSGILSISGLFFYFWGREVQNVEIDFLVKLTNKSFC